MKKTLLALAAVAAVTAGSAAAQAKVHFDVYFGTPLYTPHYQPIGYYKPYCHFVKFKVVRYDYYGNKIIVWKKKKVCEKVYYNGY